MSPQREQERPTLPPVRTLFPDCFEADQPLPRRGPHTRAHPGPGPDDGTLDLPPLDPGRRPPERRVTFPLPSAPMPVASPFRRLSPLSEPPYGTARSTSPALASPPMGSAPFSAQDRTASQPGRSEHSSRGFDRDSRGSLRDRYLPPPHDAFAFPTPGPSSPPALFPPSPIPVHAPLRPGSSRRPLPLSSAPSTGSDRSLGHDGPFAPPHAPDARPLTPPAASRQRVHGPRLPPRSIPSPPWTRMVPSAPPVEASPEAGPSRPRRIASPVDSGRPAYPYPRLDGSPRAGPYSADTAPGDPRGFSHDPALPGPSNLHPLRTTRSMTSAQLPPTTPPRGPHRPKKYACSKCTKRFSRPSALKTHMVSHTTARDHLCPVPGCGRRYSIKSNLTRHLRQGGAHPHAPAGAHGAPLAMAPAPPPRPAALDASVPVGRLEGPAEGDDGDDDDPMDGSHGEEDEGEHEEREEQEAGHRRKRRKPDERAIDDVFLRACGRADRWLC